MLKTTTSRLASVVLGYVIIIILVLTLNPFFLEVPEQFEIKFRTYPEDVILNIILFLPLGFIYRLITRQRGAWLFGALLSTVIEVIQFFIPVRTSSPTDILNNTLGAAFGAMLYDQISTRINLTPRIIGRLRLDTPLMGFIYLLLPLLWANGLALAKFSHRWPLTILIGICGAIVINDIFRNLPDSKGKNLTFRVAIATGFWFLLGAGINIRNPLQMLMVTLTVISVAVILTILPRQFPDRRFEHTTMRRLVPVFALYIFLLALWPINQPFTEWHGIFGLTDQIEESEWQGLLPRVEYLAAFSILGYLTAEWRSRAELTVAQDIPRLLAVIGGSALTLEFLVGFQAGMGASLVRFILVTLVALYGGVIYHFLRDHVRFLGSAQNRQESG
ncbi:MAG TPA: VanZ family protein [Anaerolineales bacterium]|nr:VanZ family protein [Anaerolineales bacterium]